MNGIKTPQTKPEDNGPLWCYIASVLLMGLFALATTKAQADYIYEGNQDLYDLTDESGTTNLNASDDYLSVPFALDHTFTFY